MIRVVVRERQNSDRIWRRQVEAVVRKSPDRNTTDAEVVRKIGNGRAGLGPFGDAVQRCTNAVEELGAELGPSWECRRIASATAPDR